MRSFWESQFWGIAIIFCDDEGRSLLGMGKQRAIAWTFESAILAVENAITV